MIIIVVKGPAATQRPLGPDTAKFKEISFVKKKNKPTPPITFTNHLQFYQHTAVTQKQICFGIKRCHQGLKNNNPLC